MLTAIQPAGSRRAADFNADAAGGGAPHVERRHDQSTRQNIWQWTDSEAALRRPDLWLHNGSRKLLRDIYNTS